MHELKILTSYFESVLANKKKFEICENNRDYRVNDLVNLKEFNGEEFTGREIIAIITYIFKGGSYGLDPEYCVFSFDILNKNL